jgi:hypothetical protein
MEEQSFSEQAVGVAPPRSFLLDASVLDNLETHKLVREDIKQNRIEFIFPAGLNKPDILDTCRALCDLDNFDTMYDLTMQMLEGKSLIICMKNRDGSRTELDAVQIVDKMQDLRGVDIIADYPVLVNWLTEFMAAYLLKKYPVPGQHPSPRPQAPEKSQRKIITPPKTPS